MKKVFRILGWMLLICFIIATLAFSLKESSNLTCREIMIETVKNDVIKIPSVEISNLVKNADGNLVGKKLKNINSEKIENAIKKNKAVGKVEVYKIIVKDENRYKGVLGVKVWHRKPVYRVVGKGGQSYYIDNEGVKFPVSVNYAANVLVATGNITDKFATNGLLEFVRFMEKDNFWKSQIEQIYVAENEDVFLTPLVGNHFINLGSLKDYEKKLRNLYAFYDQILTNNDWEKYRLINLKYDGLIVTTKK